MKMNGEIRVPTDRETVWRALNDPEVLKECLPGCQEIEKTSDTEMTATLVIKVGPVKATLRAVSRFPISTRPTAIRSPARAKGVPPASPRARPRSGWSPTAARRSCNTTSMRRSAASSRRSARASSIPPQRNSPNSSSTAWPRSWAAARTRKPRTQQSPNRSPAASARPEPPADPSPPSPEPAASPADAAQEGAPAEAAGPPLAPAAQRMGLPTAAWVGAVIVVAAVLILVFTGVI